MAVPLENLETALDHTFADRDLLVRALTHRSHAHERALARQDNEQLEFLGDAVLGFAVSDWLVAHFPASPEGRLSRLKAHLVGAEHLCEVARKLELGSYLHLGRGEELSGGRLKKNLLANALEAIIAALYLDGGMPAAATFIHDWVIEGSWSVQEAGTDTDSLAPQLIDFKSALQELTQARGLPHPRYIMLKESGPEHSKTFVMEVRVGSGWAAHAEGHSKKSASQGAARVVLQQLQEHFEKCAPERQ